jgi:hypothetical protein
VGGAERDLTDSLDRIEERGEEKAVAREKMGEAVVEGDEEVEEEDMVPAVFCMNEGQLCEERNRGS